jgi:hypothetical protein
MTENDLGLQLLSEGKVSEAVTHLRSAAWINPSYKSYLNLAVALRHAGLFDDALEYLYKCVKLDDLSMNAWLAFANTYTDMGEWQEAIFAYEAAFFRVSKPGTPVTHVQQVAIGYSQALLRERQLKAAWPLFELGRYERSYWALPGTQRWLGEPCDCLLVVCEGGYGDAMIFGRWLPFCKRRAKHVKLLVWDQMAEFRAWGDLGVDEIIPKSQPVDPRGIQYTTSWMSLPGISGMKSMDELAQTPVDSVLWAGYEHHFVTSIESQRIGYCWRAEENGVPRKTRSLPTEDAEALAHILSEHGQVISLCPRGKSLYRIETELWPINVVQDEALIDGWGVTASTIRSCKFVVTVDTAVAHLAGLCGVPTLLLLPCSSAWLWGTEANTPSDPWYGPHVHYFRNKDPLQWQIDQVAEVVSAYD